MNKLKCRSSLQLTLDDDFNVPDVKPDIDKIVKEHGEIRINDVKAMNGKLLVKGVLAFNLIYISDDSRPIHNINGEIPFDEVINMEDSCSDDDATVRWDLEDLSAGLINSRKLSVKSIVRLSVFVEDVYDEETAVGVEDEADVQYINKQINITSIGVSKKDIYRIKDELHLPSNKCNIFDIIYSEVELRNTEYRLNEDKFTIKGEIPIFIMYVGDNEENSIEYFETELPFSGIVDCNGCSDDMIDDITCNILSKDIQVKPDIDGEERIIDVEVVLNLNIKAYVEETLELLDDVYCPSKEATPVYSDATFENLIIKNSSKTRLIDRIRVENTQPKILQICHASGDIKVDEVNMVKDGLEVDGIVEVSLLYITAEDRAPMNSIKGIVPFSQVIEAKGIHPQCTYDIKPYIEQMSIMMLDSEEIEVKIAINLSTIVFDKIHDKIINNVTVEDLDLDMLQAMPSIIGYIVKPNDNLWKIAKRYYTTVDRIKEINDLESEMVRPGDKLLILKQMDEVF